MGINFLKKYNSAFLFFIFAFIILNLYIIFSITKYNNIKDQIVRLHVVSNSNSIDDQIVKLKISAKLEDYISNLDLENKNKNEILNILKDKSYEIIEISDSILEKENLDYKATIKIGKVFFNDSKESTTTHMDSGTYNSINILLGKADGNNFWSIICPNKENLKKLENINTILPRNKKYY